jgi:hypothetical protein
MLNSFIHINGFEVLSHALSEGPPASERLIELLFILLFWRRGKKGGKGVRVRSGVGGKVESGGEAEIEVGIGLDVFLYSSVYIYKYSLYG